MLLIVLSAALAGCSGDNEVRVSPTRIADDPREKTSDNKPEEPAEEDASLLAPSVLRSRLGVSEQQVRFERVGGRIETASFQNSRLTSLGPLRGIALRQLDMRSEAIDDLSPLASKRLEVLILKDTQVSDLSPFAGSPVEALGIDNSPVTDVTPVVSKHLKQAEFVNAPIADLSPLAGAPLEYLWIEKTAVSDISFLKPLALPKIYLKDSPVEDITPLAGKSFEELDLSGTKIADLEPLRTTRLGILWLRGTSVEDLNPLVGTEIQSLDIQETPVTNLAPLASISTLRRLNIAGSAATDVTPIVGLPLTRLVLTPHLIEQGLDRVRGMTTLQELDVIFEPERHRTLTPDQFWSLYDDGKLTPQE